MSGKGRQLHREQSAFLLAEEATELVLRAGPVALSVYLIGTLPFLLGIVAYWAAMASSAYAHHYASAGALGLALLFVWMKAFQSRYAQHLLYQLRGEDLPTWTATAFFASLSRQAALHATAVLAYPVCFVTVLPMGFVTAWYQNLTILDGEAKGTRSLMREAAAQARLWPKQAHLYLWLTSPLLVIAGTAIYLGTFPILDGLVVPELGESALLALGYIYGGIVLLSILPLAPFACFVALNIGTGMLFAVEFFHILTGADSAYARNPIAIMGNSTFLAVACALTYTVLDPIVKAGFTIRCYQGQSLRSGADLRATLARIRQNALRMAASFMLAVLAACLVQSSPIWAQAAGDAQQTALDRALDDELAERKYTWRMPREPNPDVEMPWLLQALSDLGQTIRDGIGSAFRFVSEQWERFTDWLRGDSGGGGTGWSGADFNPNLRHLIVVLVAVLVIVTVYLGWRSYRAAALVPLPEQVALPTGTPDLEDEATTAAALPEDEWFKLARDLAAQGNYRLAARALFFSTLAVLAERNIIRIARYKSNMDYANEMARRAGTLGDAPVAFSRSALLYESVWYGEHEATAETLNHLHACQERLRHDGQ